MLLRVSLFTPEHYARMGQALWIFIRLVAMQTKSNGLVLGGMPLTYAEISKRTGGFHEKFIQRSLATLKSEGYIEVKHLNYKMLRLRILNQKKYEARQPKLPFEQRTDVSFTKRTDVSFTPDKCVLSKQTLEVDSREKQTAASGPVESQDHKSDAVTSRDPATAAFRILQYDKPVGNPKFQAGWTTAFHNRPAGAWLTNVMEEFIQECQRNHIGVPRSFFESKREVEKIEESYARNGQKTPYV